MSTELNEMLQVDVIEENINDEKIEKIEEMEIKNNNKKIVVGLIALLLISIIILLEALFGGGAQSTSSAGGEAQGTWILEKVETNGEVLEGVELDLAYGGDVIYDLQEEGALVITMIGQDFTGEWVQNGAVVELMYNGGVTELQYDGDFMLMGDEETTYTMSLQ